MSCGAAVGYRCRGFSRLANPADWVPRHKVCAQVIVLAEPLRHLRFDNSWTNGIHPNAFRSDFERHRSGKTDNRELTGSINRLSGNDCAQTGDRSVVHDCAASGLENSRDLMFQAEEDAADVSVHDAVEKVIRVCNPFP